MVDNKLNNNEASVKKKPRYFREAPDPKLPNYLLPAPSLKDFYDETFYERVEDFYTFKQDGSGEVEDVIKADKSLWLRGIGNPTTANILFLTSSPTEEEADGSSSAPSFLKSGSGALFARLCTANGINIYQEYYTSLCKYPLPRKLKLKPTAKDIQYCAALLEEEIAQVKPSIIVCIGKEPASYILGLNVKLTKIEEGWIYSKKYKALVYIIDSAVKAYYKPEYYDKLDAELAVLAKRYDALANGKLDIQEIDQHYQLIDNYKSLQQWLLQMTMENNQLFAVDCEWRGMNYACGNLRSIQFCWKPGHAVFIHLFDENNKWLFDITYDEVKALLQSFFNKPTIRYFGHNFCADAVWMRNHLGLETLHRCILDTQYAFQTFNEYEELALKKLAAKYTDLGKYDLDLVFYLAERKPKKSKTVAVEEDEDISFEDLKEQKIEGNDDDGYGSIPTSILYPYGCKDVDATFRLANLAFSKLIEDGTLEYYNKIKNPYVTDGFAAMMEAGIPFSNEVTNKVRLAYLYCLSKMQFIFKDMLYKEAEDMYLKEAESLTQTLPDSAAKLAKLQEILQTNKQELDFNNGVKLIKKIFGHKTFIKLVPYYKHWFFIEEFNPSSPDHKKLWLFDLKKYTPIKTTKGDTGNALDWDRVALLPPKEQETYKPAVDKDTLKVYADRGDDLCLVLLEMSAVFTILKTFLKGDQGGLQKFVTNSQVFPNFSLTESNRPKSFKPNILNIPRYVTDWIKGAFKRVYAYIGVEITKEGKEEIRDYSNVNTEQFDRDILALKEEYHIEETITKEEFKTEEIRNCFKAKDGDYFVSADLKTAEIFAIGYLSGDNNLINALTGPDLQFAFKRVSDGKGGFKEEQVRVAYVDEIVKFTEDAKDPSLLTPLDDPDLVRLDNGELKRPGRDLHWEAVEPEAYLNTPREKLDKEKTRNACGKVANFCPSEDNFILTPDRGYIRAKDVRSGDTLVSLYGTTQTLQAAPMYDQECYDVLFSSGITAKYHKWHKLRCWDGSKLDWVTVEDLTDKHQIVCVRDKTCNTVRTSHLIDLNLHSKKRMTSNITFERNSKEFAYLMGLYLGDGSLSIAKHACVYKDIPSFTLRFCVHNSCVEKVCDIIKTLGFSDKEISTYILTDKVQDITIGCRALARYVASEFGNADSKHIPDFVFQEWDPELCTYLLAGLIDSDGSVARHGVGWEFYNTNKPLVTNTALLCNYLGYRTHVKVSESAVYKDGVRHTIGKRGKYKDCYKLLIYNISTNGLPLLLDYKQCLNLPKEWNTRWVINKEYKPIYKEIRAACGTANKIVKNTIANIRDGYTGFTEFNLAAIEQQAPDLLPLKSYWYPVKVLTKTPYIGTVIALECDTHEFIDMGMNSHNSIPYGASPSLLERSIEIQTKEKPEEGTGDKLIKAYMTTKPDVAKFLQERENEVIEKGYYLSPTGFKRHYKLPDEHSDLPAFIKKKLVGGLQRQNKNIPLQSLVADTLAIAVVKLNEEFLKRNMKARVAVPLYDAMYVVAPWYEVLWVHKLIKKCFSLDIGWNLKGGVLNFQTDHETGEAWGSHLGKKEHAELLSKIDEYWKDKDKTIFNDIEDISVKL